MILVIGGSCQGKYRYAAGLVGEAAKGLCADGQSDTLSAALARPLVNRFHLYIRRLLLDGSDPDSFVERLIEENPDAVVVMDEVGSGIVPADRSDREFREAAGRAGQRLAQNSLQVHRVICGIGNRIK